MEKDSIMTIYRMNGAAKESLVGGGITGSDLDNVKNQAVNESKDYTNSQITSKLNNLKVDYSKYTGITSDNYTVPSNGFVQVHASVASNQFDSYAVAQIDGRNVFYLHNAIQNLSGYNLQSGGVFPVSKGQEITFTLHAGAGWIQRAFVPIVVN